MIEQGIAKIQAMVKSAAELRPLRLPSDPEDVHYLTHPDGSIERVVTERRPRHFAADGIEGVVNAAHVVARRSEVLTCYVYRDVVSIEGEDAEGRRRDSVGCKLVRSEPFAALADGAKKLTGLSQSELIWHLRTTFSGVVSPASLLPTVRRLKIRSSSQGESEIQHGKASMGKAVSAEAAGADSPIPEMITVACQVFEGVTLYSEALPLASVVCALDINLQEALFTVRPLPGELARAEHEARAWIADQVGMSLSDDKHLVGLSHSVVLGAGA